jgi:hypothetical protein
VERRRTTDHQQLISTRRCSLGALPLFNQPNYDVTGRKVSDLLQASQRTSGAHTLPFNAQNLASGTYIYTLEVKAVGITSRQSRQMILLK